MASPLGIKMVKTIPPSHPLLFDQLMLKYCHYLIFNILHFICARHVPLIHSILAAKILWTRGSCTYVTSVSVSDSSAAGDFSNMANNKRQGQLDLRDYFGFKRTKSTTEGKSRILMICHQRCNLWTEAITTQLRML